MKIKEQEKQREGEEKQKTHQKVFSKDDVFKMWSGMIKEEEEQVKVRINSPEFKLLGFNSGLGISLDKNQSVYAAFKEYIISVYLKLYMKNINDYVKYKGKNMEDEAEEVLYSLNKLFNDVPSGLMVKKHIKLPRQYAGYNVINKVKK